MKSKRGILDSCDKTLFFDFEGDDIIDQLNPLLLCIYNEFEENVSDDKILKTSSVITDIILKLYNEDIDNINKDFFILRTSVIDLFNYGRIDEGLNEKLSVPYKCIRLRPK